MLCRETIAVYSQMHTKHMNVLCRQNVELLNARPGGTYNCHNKVLIEESAAWLEVMTELLLRAPLAEQFVSQVPLCQHNYYAMRRLLLRERRSF